MCEEVDLKPERAQVVASSSNFLNQSFFLLVWTIRRVRWMSTWDGQSGAADRHTSRGGTVPTIVRETRKERLESQRQQVDRFTKWQKVKDLRGQSKMSERRISV